MLTYLGTRIATSALSVQLLALACRAATHISTPVRISQTEEPEYREMRRAAIRAIRSVSTEFEFHPCALPQSRRLWILSDTELDPRSSENSITVLLNWASVSTESVTASATSLAASEFHTILPCIVCNGKIYPCISFSVNVGT